MFVAAIGIGSVFYLAKRGLIRLALRGSRSSGKDLVMSASGVVLLLVAAALTIWLTRIAFRAMYGV
jgi:hypothetical protein